MAIKADLSIITKPVELALYAYTGEHIGELNAQTNAYIAEQNLRYFATLWVGPRVEYPYSIPSGVQLREVGDFYWCLDQEVARMNEQGTTLEYPIDNRPGAFIATGLAGVFQVVEQMDCPVNQVIMSPRQFAWFQEAMPEHVPDPEVRAPLLERGFRGRLWGAEVWVHPDVPSEHFYVRSFMGPFARGVFVRA